jgi:hypothetical protein
VVTSKFDDREKSNSNPADLLTFCHVRDRFCDILEEMSAVGKFIELEELIIAYLPDEYQHVASMLEMSIEGMTLEDAMAKVQNEEERMGRPRGPSSSAAPTVAASSIVLWQQIFQRQVKPKLFIQVSERRKLSLLRQGRSHPN